MKNAVKPLTIISMILIAVGIISAAILIIFQQNLNEIYSYYNGKISFMLPIAYVLANSVNVFYAILVIATLKKFPDLLSSVISIVLFSLFILIPRQLIFVLENYIVARVYGTEGLARIATLNSGLAISEFFFRAAYILLLIAAVIARCVKKNEEQSC